MFGPWAGRDGSRPLKKKPFFRLLGQSTVIDESTGKNQSSKLPEILEKRGKEGIIPCIFPLMFPDQVRYSLQIHRNCSEFGLEGHAS